MTDSEAALVAGVRAAVAGHRAADPREAASRTAILDALDRLAAPFDEHADRTHVTGSAIVVGRRGVVLLVHRRLGFWMQPGGHLDPGETPWDAARRETEEETGLTAVHPPGGPLLTHVDVHEAAEGHVHLDLRYLLLAPDDDPAPPAHESQAVRWFDWDEAFTVGDESLQHALTAARPHAGRLVR
jgi:8-oxo-dGTP pyrophosphatase MutT (NUDIX family)